MQSGDPDGGNDGESAVSVDGINDNLDQDFGYTAPNQGQGNELGAIGDTVFLDSNGNDALTSAKASRASPSTCSRPTAPPRSPAPSPTPTATTCSAGLDSTATYVVKVDTATLPDGGVGLTNSVDPDLTAGVGGDSASSRDLSSDGPIDLDADFGYVARPRPTASAAPFGTTPTPTARSPTEPAARRTRPPRALRASASTLYEDLNNNGIIDAGDRLVGNTVTSDGTTDVNGDGTSTRPAATASATCPTATTWSTSPTRPACSAATGTATARTRGADNNSQVDPYAVSLSGGENDTTGDFGYYLDAAALGNRAWIDANNNGLQDPTEVGLGDVKVTLLITYPNGDTSTVVTTSATGADVGAYSFAGLLDDESYNASTAGDPTVGRPAALRNQRRARADRLPGRQPDRPGRRQRRRRQPQRRHRRRHQPGRRPTSPSSPPTRAPRATRPPTTSATSPTTPCYNISGVVYDDADGNGDLSERASQGGTETGLAGATVQLFTDPNGDGDPSDGVQVGVDVTTPADGSYSFTDLAPGNYVVVETNPASYSSTNDISTPNNDRVPVSLSTADAGRARLPRQHQPEPARHQRPGA